MNNNSQVTIKEISHGVFLHKQQLLKNQNDTPELMYIFKIEVKTMQVIEFTADFSESENLILEGHNDLIAVTTIQPFSSEVVAVLRLFKNWKLKSKFKFTIKPPSIELQRQYMQNALITIQSQINASRLIFKNIAYDVLSINDVTSFLRKKNISFMDIDFPPNDISLFGKEENPFDTLIHWRRPIQFISTNKGENIQLSIIQNQLDPSDIKLGAISNFWFVSALATLAEMPPLIERLFLSKDVSSEGIYRLRICINGEWVSITIDDYIPCFPDGAPIFTKCNSNDLWACLVEKAYAKISGNYLSLRGGFAYQALTDLTGCPISYYNFNDNLIADIIKDGTLWKKLVESDYKGYLISASTVGEGKESWKLALEPEENGLLNGYSYTVLAVHEVRGYQLLKMKNIWSKLNWVGDWSLNSPFWTNEIKKEVGYNIEDFETSLWMNYKDFLLNFQSVTICKVKSWYELRIKGKFLRVQDTDDPMIEVVMSKWYYTLEIFQTTEVIITLHQEDERNLCIQQLKPYMDVGIVILKVQNDSIELVDLRDLAMEREVDIEIVLDPGSYIVLPRTTGCMLLPPHRNPQNAKFLNEDGTIHELFECTLKDIFNKFDVLMNRELSFLEFKNLLECFDQKLTEEDFQNKYLKEFASTGNGVNFRGFVQFWLSSLEELGEEIIYNWLNNLGYDKGFYTLRARAFVLSFHSDLELTISVKDAVQTDLDNKANALIIERFGQESETKRGVKCLYTYSEQVHAYSYGILNEHSKPIEATIDCSTSKFMLHSTKNGITKKVISNRKLNQEI